ncbi:MAG: alpha/beta fold hydrolase [Bacteroidota bacterium]|nr:alpha/beta fold hydrolase [Bacteroidota bacterium]
MESFSFQKLFFGITKANQKIVSNYLGNFSGYNHDSRDIALTYLRFFSKFSINPTEISKVQNLSFQYFIKQQEIWKNIFNESITEDGQKEFLPIDKRFAAEEWSTIPHFNFIKQNYLLTERYIMKILDDIISSEERRQKIKFYTRHFIYLFSPSNFLFTNPEALKLAYKTKGESLWIGFNNFLNDLEKGRITQVDESAFEIGENIAASPGGVIYENELIQLIQYSPTTKKVYDTPLLIVPPWINKYYIFDLQAKNSVVKYLTDQGITVFIISWRNPMPGMGNLTFDNYVQEGVLEAINVTKKICDVKKINTLGYCIGGTLLSVAASILKIQKKDVIKSITFLASMIDFTDIGPMGDVIHSALFRKIERGEILTDGVLHGHDMESAFNLIRAKDLVWHYVVNNYLMGLQPKAFDVMYWTNDNTNLPSKMYLFYLKEMISANNLRKKNALVICDTRIDIGVIDVPVIVVAFKKDYISPPETVFTTTELVSGSVEFILGESGHVMGVVSPPSKKKYGHYLHGKLGNGFDEWEKTAEFSEKSWWLTWVERLKQQSGIEIAATKELGNYEYTLIETAPGKYVREKCNGCLNMVNENKNLQIKKRQLLEFNN